MLTMVLALLVAGGVFSQPVIRPNPSAFNGGYSGGVANTDNRMETTVSSDGGIRLNGSSVRGPAAVGGGTVSIPVRIQGSINTITYDGSPIGSWYYLYSSGTKTGVAAYISGKYFLFFGADAVREGLEGSTLAGYSASDMSTKYEGTLVKGAM
jgi:hypothetical protein